MSEDSIRGMGSKIQPEAPETGDSGETGPIVPETSAVIGDTPDEIEPHMQQQSAIPEMTAGINQTELIASLENDLAMLDESHKKLVRCFNDLGAMYEKIGDAVSQVAELIKEDSSSTHLLDATKQMQETQMSFNLQYLQLQSQMQNENRQYTAVSNIMKDKA